MTDRSNFQLRPIVAIGTGRCGTQFLKEVMQTERDVYACHESDPLNEAFHRYCQWNRLPVDDGGFLEIKRREIEAAHRDGKIFFESSAYLSLSIGKLFDAFRPRFVLITRNPIDTVNSLWAKGWYEIDYHKQNENAAVGYHAVGAPHHFFSRLVPRGPEFNDWQTLCRIGKLAWYWSTLHREILTQFEQLPERDRTIVQLEQFDHPAYLRLAEFARLRPRLSARRFLEIAAARPGRLPRHRPLRSWSAAEVQAFSVQVAGVAGKLGYDADFDARWRDSRRADLPRVAAT